MRSIDIKIKVGKQVKDVTLYNPNPLPKTPKTYKKIGVFGHNIGNAYNSDLITIYKVKKPSLLGGSKYRFSIYRDGCFYPYYGVIVGLNDNDMNF